MVDQSLLSDESLLAAVEGYENPVEIYCFWAPLLAAEKQPESQRLIGAPALQKMPSASAAG